MTSTVYYGPVEAGKREDDGNPAFTWYLWRTGEDGGVFSAGFLASGFLVVLFLLMLCTETFLFTKCDFLVWNTRRPGVRLDVQIDGGNTLTHD